MLARFCWLSDLPAWIQGRYPRPLHGMINAVAYTFQLLSSTESGATALRAEVASALDTAHSWEQFVEVRMGAGPTVRIDQLDEKSDSYDVSVTWGAAQAARSRVRGQDAALQAADRLALALYDIRASSRVADQ